MEYAILVDDFNKDYLNVLKLYKNSAFICIYREKAVPLQSNSIVGYITTKTANNMTKKQIFSAIAEMALWQGFYGRLLYSIKEDPSILDELEKQNFADRVELIMYLEGC